MNSRRVKRASIRAWFPFYGSDFYGSFKVRGLSLKGEAGYLRLLWAEWNDPRCSLPDDDVELRQLSGLSGDDLKRVRNCFFRKRGRLYNARLLKEWHKAKEKSRKATESINQRWGYGRNTNVERSLYSSPSPSPSPLKKELREEKRANASEKISAAPAPRKEAELPDDAWLESLKSELAYRGINIPIQLSKCQNWCRTNKKKLTRKRFVNWLNREDKELTLPLGNSHGCQVMVLKKGYPSAMRCNEPVYTPKAEEKKPSREMCSTCYGNYLKSHP